MVVTSISLDRREAVTHEGVVTSRREAYTPLVESLPSLWQYATRLRTEPQQPSFDGGATRYLADRGAIAAALDSEAGRGLEDDAEASVGQGILPVTEETVVHGAADDGVRADLDAEGSPQ